MLKYLTKKKEFMFYIHALLVIMLLLQHVMCKLDQKYASLHYLNDHVSLFSFVYYGILKYYGQVIKLSHKMLANSVRPVTLFTIFVQF